MNVIQTSSSTREAILTKIQFSSIVHLASCFQFDTLNRRDDLKFVSKLTIFPFLSLILRLLKETYSYVRCTHHPGHGFQCPQKLMAGLLAASLPARNAVAAFTFM